MPKTLNASLRGFSLLELMVAMVITLIITGAMYGLVASGNTSFRREPALMDRQQQIRIAMDRIQEDVMGAGGGLGDFFQSFAENLGGTGQIGVRGAASGILGGANTDALEIRSRAADCPPVRVTARGGAGGAVYTVNAAEQTAIWGPPAKPSEWCYQRAGWVALLFGDGNAKWGWRHAAAGFTMNAQPPTSQMIAAADMNCSLFTGVLAGGVCALPGQVIEPTVAAPLAFVALDRVRYLIANDPNDRDQNGLAVTGLYRSATGGVDPATETFFPDPTVAPAGVWQLVGRGIEDLQIRYRTFAGWQDQAPVITPTTAAGTGWDNVVREVEITLWARTVGEAGLQGESIAAGNGRTGVRGSLITTVAPRAAQVSLRNEPNAAKQWQ